MSFVVCDILLKVTMEFYIYMSRIIVNLYFVKTSN